MVLPPSFEAIKFVEPVKPSVPELPDVPLFIDLAKTEADRQALIFMLARQEAAKPYFGPPDVPPARLALLRRAFDATVRDTKFLALAGKANVAVD